VLGMVREATRRQKKYERGLDGEAIGKKYAAQKEGMVESEKVYMAAVAGLEEKVKKLVEAAGVSSMQVAQYLNVARKMMVICDRFSGATRDDECRRVYELWIDRGLNPTLIGQIAAICGCSITAAALGLASLILDFWSDSNPVVTLTAGGEAGVVALPDVVVDALPTGLTLRKVVAMLIISVIRDTSGVNNAVDVATGHVEVRRGPGGTWTRAIDIGNNAWAVVVANGQDRGGAPHIGNTEISAEVDRAATYNFELDDLGVDGNNLLLLDVLTGLRFIYW
jgi:hypothetical protein